MTKDWDSYKDTILALYEHQTLATVMEVMQRDYNFVASTRAYRQKLDKWGKRKYKKRKGKSDNSPEVSDAESVGKAAASSRPASPELSHRHTSRRQQSAADAGHRATTSTSHQGDVNYSLDQTGANVSNTYGTTQYQNPASYDATNNTCWSGNPDTTAAYGFSQAPLDVNVTAYDYGGTSFSATNNSAVSFQYMDTSAGGYPMADQLDYTTYEDSSWDHAQDG
ncbi:uncharacterized protein PG998_014068 [Apiospora kogelbergensis]|uniref:Clr5 domain-containing protein n=1 Tax=Apiospora kogelbergensis TaxID=1337665 RepID=A0AAW0QYV3_9PEZI